MSASSSALHPSSSCSASASSSSSTNRLQIVGSSSSQTTSHSLKHVLSDVRHKFGKHRDKTFSPEDTNSSKSSNSRRPPQSLSLNDISNLPSYDYRHSSSSSGSPNGITGQRKIPALSSPLSNHVNSDTQLPNSQKHLPPIPSPTGEEEIREHERQITQNVLNAIRTDDRIKRTLKTQSMDRVMFLNEKDKGLHGSESALTSSDDVMIRLKKGCMKKPVLLSPVVKSKISDGDVIDSPERIPGIAENEDGPLSPSQAAAGKERFIRRSINPEPEDISHTVKRSVKFDEHVTVVQTFAKNEYNRKTDPNCTFRKLNAAVRIQIRDELNKFKRTEMKVHPDSSTYTCFH